MRGGAHHTPNAIRRISIKETRAYLKGERAQNVTHLGQDSYFWAISDKLKQDRERANKRSPIAPNANKNRDWSRDVTMSTFACWNKAEFKTRKGTIKEHAKGAAGLHWHDRPLSAEALGG